MKIPERNVDYLIGEIDGALSIHVGRGYFKENGKYKQTLSIPVEGISNSHSLYDDISRFESIFAIDSNNKKFSDWTLVVSCAVHISLQYEGNSQWNMILTKLSAILAIGTESNPEVIAWKRIIQAFSPKVQGMMALVVDSELGDIPLFNARKKPICNEFFIPTNTQLIYASADKDSLSPLNKAIKSCDADATRILNIVSQNCDLEKVRSNIFSSENGYIEL